MQNIILSSQFITTFLIFLVAASGVTALIVRERKPRVSLTPSLIPATSLMLGGGIVALLALVHLINLVGLHTGR